MRPAALHDAVLAIEYENFVDHIFAIALDVTLHHHRTRPQMIALANRRKTLPFLARMQIAKGLWQVPGAIAKCHRMKNQRGRQRSAERRLTAIPRMIIAGRGDIVLNRRRVDNEFIAADIAADVNFIGTE